MEKGYGQMFLSEYMKEEIKRSVEKISETGLHMVHIFYKDVISGTMECRKGYFEGYADAELFAYEYDEKHKDRHETYLVLVDGELYIGRFDGEDAESFRNEKKQISAKKREKCL